MVHQPPRKRSKQVAEPPVEGGDTVRISVLVTKDQRQRLKVLAATRGVTISEVVRDGITRFLGSTTS